jgi:hypothetical protein
VILEILAVLAVVVPGLALFALASWAIPRRHASRPLGSRVARADLAPTQAAPRPADRGKLSGENGRRTREAA